MDMLDASQRIVTAIFQPVQIVIMIMITKRKSHIFSSIINVAIVAPLHEEGGTTMCVVHLV